MGGRGLGVFKLIRNNESSLGYFNVYCLNIALLYAPIDRCQHKLLGLNFSVPGRQTTNY